MLGLNRNSARRENKNVTAVPAAGTVEQIQSAYLHRGRTGHSSRDCFVLCFSLLPREKSRRAFSGRARRRSRKAKYKTIARALAASAAGSQGLVRAPG